MNQPSKGIWAWQIVRLIVFSALGIFALFLLFNGFTEGGIRLIIRWSAKIDIVCFCIAFAASGIHHLVQNSFSFWLYRNQKYFGIAFVILHLIHLAALGVLQYFFHPVFEKAASTSLVAGGIAYIFAILMLLTSFEKFSKWLSVRQWKGLHTIGGYWIMLVFFSTYAKRVMDNEYWPLFFLIMLIFVLGIRLWDFTARRSALNQSV